MQNIQLENTILKAEILSNFGARLSSLKFFKNNKWMILVFEKSYDSNSKNTWQHGGIPILFPFAGRVWADKKLGYYKLEDKFQFQMPIHGFASHLPWKLKSRTDSSASLELFANEETKKIFPWKFHLILTWELIDASLLATLKIVNLACIHSHLKNKSMLFSPGLHPYIEINNDDFNNNPYIQLDNCVTQKVNPDGSANETISEIKIEEKIELNSCPSLIIKNLKENKLRLNTAKESTSIKISTCQNSKYFVLWSGDKTKYFCPEPWSGLPDAIKNNCGLHRLKEGEEKTFYYKFEFS